MTDVELSVQSYNIQVAISLTSSVSTVDKTVVQLNDIAGTDVWEVKDLDGFPVARIDSKGNLYLRGSVRRV